MKLIKTKGGTKMPEVKLAADIVEAKLVQTETTEYDLAVA